MKRGTGLSRKTPLERGPGPKSRTRMRQVNRKRIASLRAVQFGVAGYREHVIASPCLVTGTTPCDPAHILKSRGAGGREEHMGPLCREVHTDFDSMGEERFRLRWGIGKERVRDRCRDFRVAWNARVQP